MCDDCRVTLEFEAGFDPYAARPRPVTRTTQDYLREEAESKAKPRKPDA